jgi:lipoprotein-releasing system permease protein
MFAIRIAQRYLFSKKSTNAINIISAISMVGMGVGAFALIVVLSVFNGFEGLVTDLYSAFYPQLTVTSKLGKTFEDTPELFTKVLQTKGVAGITKTLEENAYLEYNDKATLAVIKGVDSNYTHVNRVQDFLYQGEFILEDARANYAVIGANLNLALNIEPERGIELLGIKVPRKGVKSVLLPEDAFSSTTVLPAGIFMLQQEFDSKYVFVSLGLVQELLGEENAVSAYEIKLQPGTNEESIREQLKASLGNDFVVRTRLEMNEVLFRVIKMERWAVFAILTFIMLIISFNIIGSLSMLVMEKHKDISILKAMGANVSDIRNIFLLEGIFTGCIGAFSGLGLGLLLCLLQQHFGFIKLNDGGGSFVVDAYPVSIRISDVVLTFFTVVIISSLASLYPARKAGAQSLKVN